jgi:putative membrane protein
MIRSFMARRGRVLILGAAAVTALGGLTALYAISASPAKAQAPLVKDETVYAILSPSGQARKVIVSDWLKNLSGAAQISDYSELTGIQNVAGDEKVTRSGKNLTWQANGKDIYYQGQSQGSLPLAVHIKYSLDGRDIKPEELAGKSGKLKMTISMENLESHAKLVAGVRRELKTPFAAIALVALPPERFKGVEVSENGRIVSDGKNSMVLGVLLPGLGQDLRAGGIKDLSLPEALTISAQTTGFSLGSILVSASSDLSSLIGKDPAKSLSSLGLDELGPGMQKMAAGGDYLASATHSIYGGSLKLRQGLDGAFDSLAPQLDKYKPTFDSAMAFIGDDAKVAAARRLLTSVFDMDKIDTGSIQRVLKLLDDKNLKLIDKTMADAKGLDMKSLTSMPFAGLVMSDSNIQGLAQALSDSDAFYRGIDDRRLQSASDYVGKASAIFATAKDFAALASGYDDSKLAALRRLSARKPPAAAAGLLSDTASLRALSAKLQAMDALSAQEKAALAYLIGAAEDEGAERDAANYALNSLVPGILKASAEFKSEKAAFDVGSAFFGGHPESYLNGFIASLKAQRAEHQRNHFTYDMALSVLKMAIRDGGVSKSIAKIDTVQRDLAGLEPLLSEFESMSKNLNLSLTGADASTLPQKVEGMIADLKACRDILIVAQSLLSPENVTGGRQMAAKLPELSEGLSAIRSGVDSLSDNLAKLDAGLSDYNSQAIQKLAGKLGGLAKTLSGIQGLAGELLGLSSDYRSFSGLPARASGQVRFVMRTEEIGSK